MKKKQVRKLKYQRNKFEKREQRTALQGGNRRRFLENLKIRAMKEGEMSNLVTSCELCERIIDTSDYQLQNVTGLRSRAFSIFVHKEHLYDEKTGEAVKDFTEKLRLLHDKLTRLELEFNGFLPPQSRSAEVTKQEAS